MPFQSATIEFAVSAVELSASRQIDAACELALFGADARARDICASIFLQHAPLLAHKRSLRQSFVECLLLLNMTVLLVRLVRAVDGVDLVVTGLAGSPPGMLLSFGSGATLQVPSFAPPLGRATRAKRASRWSETILDAAERDGLAQADRSLFQPVTAMQPECVG